MLPSEHMERSPADLDRIIAIELDGKTYAEVAEHFKVSRGRVYQAALRLGVRKNEQRIRMRCQERKQLQREFLQSVLDATAKADVLDYLAGLPDSSVQLHLTSPPYNLGKSYGDAAGADAHRFHYYLGWLLQVTSEMARTLAEGGVLFLQLGSTQSPQGGAPYPIDTLIFQHLAAMGLTFQSRVVWVIPHGLTPKRRLSERHETALVFSKGPISTFNANPVRTPQKQPGKRAFKGPNKGQLSGHPFGAHPSNVWAIANCGNQREQGASGHPAPMPLELARRAVLLYTLPGDLVVDVFSGSGTTHTACRQLSRSFSGCDLFYEDLRAKRLAAVGHDLLSPLPGVTDESLAVWSAEAVPSTSTSTTQLRLVPFPG